MRQWFLGLILFLLFALPANAAEPTQRVLVKFRPAISPILQERLHQQLGARLLERLRAERTVVVQVPAGYEEIFAQRYQQNPLVEYAEPDALAQAVEIPNDPEFPNQWGQTKIQTPQAWDVTSGSPAVQIAILDTGITNNHADLTGQVDSWVNFTDTASPYDLNSHGSHVAGIAAAVTNNNLGVAGTGRNTRLDSVKVLDDSGSGYYSWVINGIYWAADNGAEVINMSLGGSSSSTSLQQAVDYAWSKGVVLTAAAGNNGSSSRLYPAYYSNNIAVAATDQNDVKASWSNYGSWVDVAAPGVSIISTTPDNNYAYYSGTSMATPHAAGVAALIKAAFPDYTNQQIRNRLESTADNIAGTGSYWTYGRINAAAAVASPLPSPSPVPGDFTTAIASHTATARWSSLFGGRIDFSLRLDILSGSSNQVILKEATDTLGNWGLYQNRTRVDVYVNGVRYRTNFSWDDVNEVATLNLGALGITLNAGDSVSLSGWRLANDTRGAHWSRLEILDGAMLVSQNQVNFNL